MNILKRRGNLFILHPARERAASNFFLILTITANSIAATLAASVRGKILAQQTHHDSKPRKNRRAKVKCVGLSECGMLVVTSNRSYSCTCT